MAEGDKKAWVERVLGVTFSAAPDARPDAGPDPAAALKRWSAARQKVVGDLQALTGAIGASDDPERAKAIILLQAIAKNLTAAPTTPQSVNALERYLTSDEIIREAEGPNGYRVKLSIRRPLLAALKTLRASLPA